MAAGLAVPVSGPYLATYNSLTLGVQNDDGYVLNCRIHGQEMSETDRFGNTMVEGVYRGQNWRARMRGLEWKNGLVAMFQIFGQVVIGGVASLAPTLNGGDNLVVNVGDLFTRYADPLVLTAVLGNPPTTPQSLTATNAVVAPEMVSEFMMTSKIRELPIELCLIPYNTVIGSITFAVPFTTT